MKKNKKEEVKVKSKKEIKISNNDVEDIKLEKIERILAGFFGIVAIVLIIIAFKNDIFIPSAAGITALSLSLIAYSLRNCEKKIYVYLLFITIFILIAFIVTYTALRMA